MMTQTGFSLFSPSLYDKIPKNTLVVGHAFFYVGTYLKRLYRPFVSVCSAILMFGTLT